MKKLNLPLIKKKTNELIHFNFNKLKKGIVTFIAGAGLLSASAATPDCTNYGNGQAQNIVYTVNGNTVTTLSGNVSAGAVVNVCFNLSAGADSTIFTLVSYKAPGS